MMVLWIDQKISKTQGAKTGENIAYKYTSSGSKRWLNSPSHKENIVGNFTHFGIGENAVTGKKYYTNIFAKI
jgi:uncharacterized protein YkwD